MFKEFGRSEEFLRVTRFTGLFQFFDNFNLAFLLLVLLIVVFVVLRLEAVGYVLLLVVTVRKPGHDSLVRVQRRQRLYRDVRCLMTREILLVVSCVSRTPEKTKHVTGC